MLKHYCAYCGADLLVETDPQAVGKPAKGLTITPSTVIWAHCPTCKAINRIEACFIASTEPRGKTRHAHRCPRTSQV